MDYATADGSASIADGDYAATAGTLSFAVGETQKTITVPVMGDAGPESHENFFINLSNARIETGPLVLMPVSGRHGRGRQWRFQLRLSGNRSLRDREPKPDGDVLASPLHAFALEFDLSSLPAGATVTAATLQFVETVNTGSAIDVHGYAGDQDGEATLANPFNVYLDNKLGSVEQSAKRN